MRLARLLELVTRPFAPEVIGVPECPLLHRWTIGTDRLMKDAPIKLMLHHFLPEARDRDPHDHPRPFWTFVLTGEYIDESGVPEDPNGFKLKTYFEEMSAGTLRYRPAGHTHRTWTGDNGAWTLVLMGPMRRSWGFWRDGRWWPFKLYEERFGHGMRCD